MNDDLDVAFADYEAALCELESAEDACAARDAALHAEWWFLIQVDAWVSERVERAEGGAS